MEYSEKRDQWLLFAAMILGGSGGWILGYTPGWSSVVGGLLLFTAGFVGAARGWYR